MRPVTITANLDLNPWADLADQAPLTEALLTRVGMLPDGTSERRPVVMLLVELDGKPVMVQVTWRMWKVLAAALAATPVAQMEEM